MVLLLVLLAVEYSGLGCGKNVGEWSHPWYDSRAPTGATYRDPPIVTSTHPWPLRVFLVELVDCDLSIVEVFCKEPDFVMFWLRSFPLSSLLDLVIVKPTVNDFVHFLVFFSVYLNRRTVSFDQGGELVDLVRFEQRGVRGIVSSPREW